MYKVESRSHFTLERCLHLKPAAKPSSATSSATPAKRKSGRLILSATSTRTESPDAMSQPQYAPAATAGGQQNGPVSEIQSDALHSSPRAQSRLLPVIRYAYLSITPTCYRYHAYQCPSIPTDPNANMYAFRDIARLPKLHNLHHPSLAPR